MVTPSRVFAPGKIGRMEVKNRLVMGAVGNSYATEDGYITQRQIDHYVEFAKGGVGLIVTQTFNVSGESQIPRRTSLYHDQFISQLRALPEAVHKYGARICAQISRRSGAPLAMRPTERPGHAIFIPSYLPLQGYTEECKEASLADIARLVEDFAEAARRAKEAGFDGVEFHGCHGPRCVLCSFLSPFTNRRDDEYGGTPEKRARLACEVVARVSEKVGPDFALIFKMNGNDGMEGGTTVEEAVRQARLIEQAGADAIVVSGGMEPWPFWTALPSYSFPKGILVPYAAAIKKAVKIPVVAAGRIDYSLAEEILKDGKADFAVFCRPLLADPYLPNKLKEGRVEDILNCIYCNNCMGPVGGGCTVNPALFREKEFEIKPVASTKRVMVAGGGLAGMEAAKVLAERGHKVSLYEKSEKLGGQWDIAARQEDKAHFAEFTRYLSRAMDKAGVDVKLNQELTAQMVKEQRPDAVVLATGATTKTLPVPGSEGKNVIQANDLIMGKAKTGTEVVVIGGRAVGMEVALSLARQGKKVSLITRRNLGRGLETILYTFLRDMLIKEGVPVYQNAPVSEIRDNGVYFFHNGDLAYIKADTVVLAVGVEPEKQLARELKQTAPGIPAYEIGDCVEPGNAMLAVGQAAEVAHQI